MEIQTKYNIGETTLYFDKEDTRLHLCKVTAIEVTVSNYRPDIKYSLDRVDKSVTAEDHLQAFLTNKEIPVIKTDAINLFKNREEFLDYVSGKGRKDNVNT